MIQSSGMAGDAMFIDPEGFPFPAFCCLEYLKIEDGGWVLGLRSQQPTSNCPTCHRPSAHPQSHYHRRLADLPWSGRVVSLRFCVRRFYCRHSTCSRRIFTERFDDEFKPHARRTLRLQAACWQIAYALGGEAGARLAGQLAMAISADTLLRQLKQTSLPPKPTPRVLGVDDWSYCRGRRFGTILVDLETHQPVELLPDRETPTLAVWLKAHPGIAIISRDRAGHYAEGARQGAPDACQVADRWHLLKNLREAVERVIDHHYVQVKQVARMQLLPAADPVSRPPETTLPAPGAARTLKPASRATARTHRMDRHQQVRQLHQQGVAVLPIARQLRMARKTVRRYLKASVCPERAARPPQNHHKIDPYRAYLQQRWNAGCHVAITLWREIVAQGFHGARSAVYRAVAPWRVALGEQAPPPPPAPPPSPRRVTWWLLDLIKPKNKPSDPSTTPTADADEIARQRFIQTLCRQCPTIDQARTLANAFIAMVRQSRVDLFSSWLEQIQHGTVSELHGFANGLLKDQAAVRAALSLPWSNGQVEGQINRLKLTKRQMYGRASFTLLRARVLHPP